MSNLLLRKILSSMLYFVLAIVIECYLFASLGWGLFPNYGLFDIGIILFISCLIFACRSRRGTNIFIGVAIGIQIIVSYLNIIMKAMLNDVFSIKMMALVGETAEVLTLSMFPFAPIIFFGIIVSILVITLTFLRRIPINEKESPLLKKYAVRFFVLIGLTFSMVLYSFQSSFLKKLDNELYLLGDDYLFNTFSSNQQSLKKFGTFGYYIEDLSRLIIDVEPLKRTTLEDLKEYLGTSTYNPQDSKLWNVLSKNGDDNIFVIMAESFEWYAISPEITPVLYALANGYDFGKAGERNSKGELQTQDGWRLYEIYDFPEVDIEDRNGEIQKYLDILRKDYDYNEETNTFTKIDGVSIYDEEFENTYGMTLINYYSKAKTDYSETSVILGNYPYNQSFVERTTFSGTDLYSDVNYYFSLPNVLKDSGYINEGEASYFHGYKSRFYARETLLPTFGFDNMMFFEDYIKNPQINYNNKLSICINDSQLVSVFGEQMIHRDENGNKKSSGPWLSFMTTVTTHGEYTSEKPLLSRNYAFIDAVDYAGKPDDVSDITPNSIDGQVRTYLAGCLDTEYAVAYLLNYLIKYNEFDNTTIVFYADHNAYYDGLDISYKAFYYDEEATDFSSFRSDYYMQLQDIGAYGTYASERYSVPCFIYATDLDVVALGEEYDENSGETYKVQYIEKFTCAFDILPTLLTMCGIEYNPHYYLGYPVFAVENIDGEQIEVGTDVIISHTGGYFNNKIFSEDGLVAVYQTSDVTSADIKQFSRNCVKQLEKWYQITALYKYNYFEKVPKR